MDDGEKPAADGLAPLPGWEAVMLMLLLFGSAFLTVEVARSGSSARAFGPSGILKGCVSGTGPKTEEHLHDWISSFATQMLAQLRRADQLRRSSTSVPAIDGSNLMGGDAAPSLPSGSYIEGDAAKDPFMTVASFRAFVTQEVTVLDAELLRTTDQLEKRLASSFASRPRATAKDPGATAFAGIGCDLGEENVDPAPELPAGPYAPPDDETTRLPEQERNVARANAVKEAFLHSWKAYTKFAIRFDELCPRTKCGKNWNDDPHSLLLSAIDGLTTMHLMGLHDEVDSALMRIRQLDFDVDLSMSQFEAMIRVVGGLLSIYELRGEKEPEIIEKVRDIADRLLWAYNTTSGVPHQTVNLQTRIHNNPDWSGGLSVLSELGTVQLELRTLSFHTGDPIYDMKATHIMSVIRKTAPRDMLCPVFMSAVSGRWSNDHIALGALGDSFYEYLLKQYLLTGKTEETYRDMFAAAMNAIVDKLLFHSIPSGFTFVAEYRRGDYYYKMDHLACFIAGTLAYGAHAIDSPRKAEVIRAAAGITKTCYLMYHRQASGVSPEYVEFPGKGDFINGAGYYLLRPEALEAMFYMWRLTGE